MKSQVSEIIAQTQDTKQKLGEITDGMNASLAQSEMAIDVEETESQIIEKKIGINRNTLLFKDKDLQYLYLSYLYDDEPFIKLEFRSKLIIIITYFYSILILQFANQIINLAIFDQDAIITIVQLFFIFTVAILGCLAFLLHFRRKYWRYNSVPLITLVLILLQAYLIFFEESILEKNFDVQIKTQIDNSLILFATIYIGIQALQSSYLGVMTLSAFTCTFYLIARVFSNGEANEAIFSVTILTISCWIICRQSYSKDKIMKTLFTMKKEEKLIQKARRQSILDTINDIQQADNLKIKSSATINKFLDKALNKNEFTDIERIAFLINSVKSTIESIGNTVIYLEVQKQCQQCFKDLEIVQKILIKKENLWEFDVDKQLKQDIEVTDDVRKFVKQHYQDPVLKSDELQKQAALQKAKQEAKEILWQVYNYRLSKNQKRKKQERCQLLITAFQKSQIFQPKLVQIETSTAFFYKL